jgi:Subtilase family/IPT/TIG domain
VGTVYAPYAAVNIGSGTGSSNITGALWSGTQVNIQSGVEIMFAPFIFCTPPSANAGPDQDKCVLTTVNLAANAPATGMTGKWSVVSGPSTSASQFTDDTKYNADFIPAGGAIGTYVLRWTLTNEGCVASDDVNITINPLPTISGILSACIGSTTMLTGSATADATMPWSSSIPSIATVNSAGEVTGIAEGTTVITYKNSNGCSTTATVTVHALPLNIDAGPDKPYNFDGITSLTGTSGTTGTTFKWTAPVGGGITTADDQATINVSAPGIYSLAVRSAQGCISIDEVLVSNKVNQLIGSELSSVYYNNPTGLPSPFFIIENGKIRIDVIVKVNNYDYVLNLLQQTAPIDYGLTNIVTNGENGLGKKELIITGDYPIANLLKLNDLGDYINYCRPFYEAFSNNSGLVSSAGDTTMRSHLVRSGYKLDGSGVKVGVISNSFATITNGTTATQPFNPVPGSPQTFTTNTAVQDISNGDLPAVTVLQDYPIRSTDEGRAMLQIVHDVAPGAELYFRTGFLTAGDFATGIKELKDAGCKVIVDDVTYITEPYLKDGVVAQAVDAVKAEGVSYFSAAGNFANRSYEKDFTPADASQAGFIGKKAHDFSGSGDIFQHVTMAPGNYTIVLQWVDDIYSNGQIQGTHYDLDMFWTSNTNGTGLKGFNRNNSNGDPIEILPFIITETTDANFLIVNNTTDGNPARVKFIIYKGDVQILEYNEGNSTLVGQANAAGAIAVGAARYDKAQPYLATPLIEAFSSIGGTKAEGVVRNKPDLVAPDGVNTTVKMGQDYPNNALDGYSNFFGTSAAAPHAAAVAALIMEGKKKFLGMATTSPNDLKFLLQSTAVDMETSKNLPGTNFDYISGFGLVDAEAALRTFAAPTPALITFEIPSTTPLTIPGKQNFTVIVTGENFSVNTVVYIGETPLPTTFISTTEVSAVIPTFEGNRC